MSEGHAIEKTEAKYAKNHFQQNRYSVFESHVMRKESISTKFYDHMVTVKWCRG